MFAQSRALQVSEVVGVRILGFVIADNYRESESLDEREESKLETTPISAKHRVQLVTVVEAKSSHFADDTPKRLYGTLSQHKR